MATTFLPSLLNSFDLPRYDSESRKMHVQTVVYMSKIGGWKRGEMTYFEEGLLCGNWGVGGNCGLIKFLQVNDTIISNFFKW